MCLPLAPSAATPLSALAIRCARECYHCFLFCFFCFLFFFLFLLLSCWTYSLQIIIFTHICAQFFLFPFYFWHSWPMNRAPCNKLGVAAVHLPPPQVFSPLSRSPLPLSSPARTLSVLSVLHPLNPLCWPRFDLGDGCEACVWHAACGRANLYNGSLNSFTYNAYHICIAT